MSENTFPDQGAIFPNDEKRRMKLANGSEDLPKPSFVQPDTGVHNAGENPIDIETNASAQPHQSSEPENLDGGYY